MITLSDVPELPEFLRPTTPVRLAVGPAPISELGWRLLAGHMVQAFEATYTISIFRTER